MARASDAPRPSVHATRSGNETQEAGPVDRIRRRHFEGSWLIFWLMCVTGIGIPFAILYLVDSTIEIEYPIEDAEAFLEQRDRERTGFRIP